MDNALEPGPERCVWCRPETRQRTEEAKSISTYPDLKMALEFLPVLLIRNDSVSIMKTIAQFHVNLTRVIPVKAAKGEAIVIFHAAIGNIERGERRGNSLAEILAQRDIERRVLRQVVAWRGLAGKGVAEARAVINVGGSVRMSGEGNIAANIERVALVVIERSELRRKRKISEPAGDGATAFGNLIGVW